MVPPHTDDLRIRRIDALVTPAQLIARLPCDEAASQTVADARRERLLARSDSFKGRRGMSCHPPRFVREDARVPQLAFADLKIDGHGRIHRPP